MFCRVRAYNKEVGWIISSDVKCSNEYELTEIDSDFDAIDRLEVVNIETQGHLQMILRSIQLATQRFPITGTAG